MVVVCAPHARRAWDRLAADVDAALADDKMPPSFEVARGLEFIEQCANEALRRRPVAPLSLLENNLQPLWSANIRARRPGHSRKACGMMVS